jgi:hypothetical protein
MTPRCRKPVVLVSGSNLCHLANLNTLENRQKQQRVKNVSCSSSTEEEEGKDINVKDKIQIKCEINSSTNHTSVLSEVSEESFEEDNIEDVDLRMYEGWPSNDISESGSLTSTFRSYLLNRSVLTASPVDLSFSSRTGDFDSSESKIEEKILGSESLSKSLLYCLDGNEPSPSSAMKNQVNNNDSSSNYSVNTDTMASLSKQFIDKSTKEYDTMSQSCSTSKDKFGEVESLVAALNSNSEPSCRNMVHQTSL